MSKLCLRWVVVAAALMLGVVFAVSAAARPVELREGVLAEGSGPSRDIEETVWFQGFLADASTGDPIDASYNVVARIYDQISGGSLLWGPETHNGVTITDGWFNIELGSVVSPLPDFASPPYYLQLTVDGENMVPRLKLASVPSAFQAGGGAVSPPLDWVYSGSGQALDLTHDGSDGDAIYVSREFGGNTDFAIYARSNSDEAVFRGWHYGDGGGAEAPVLLLDIQSEDNPSPVVDAATNGAGPAYYGLSGGRYTAHYEGTSDSVSTHVVHSQYRGGNGYGVAVYGESNVIDDSWGIGGHFDGGYVGCYGEAHSSAIDPFSGLSAGVWGYANGVDTNYGIYGQAGGGSVNYAGYFDGDIYVGGTIYTPGPLGMRMDHPEDPANKYLNQAAVVSDDVKTVYDGVAVLDGAGEATVELPEWAELVSGDFRYQLTCVGAYAPVYVADEIEGGVFTIAGGEPGMKVSWQVTGLRNDAYARAHPFPVEQDKAGSARGKYMYPEAYGLAAEAGESYRARAIGEEYRRASNAKKPEMRERRMPEEE